MENRWHFKTLSKKNFVRRIIDVPIDFKQQKIQGILSWLIIQFISQIEATTSLW